MDHNETATRQPSGVWIALEGGEGSGKSTQMALLTQRYGGGHTSSAGVARDVVFTREPGGTGLGATLRELLLHSDQPIDERCEALLMAADRAAHWTQIVRPALERGALVIADRSAWSSVVYQGYGRDLGQQDVAALSTFATGDRWPDLAVLLDVDVDTGHQRRATRTADRIEREGDSFLQKVRNGYLEQAIAHPDRIVVVDAALDVDTVHHALVWAIDDAVDRADGTGWRHPACADGEGPDEEKEGR